MDEEQIEVTTFPVAEPKLCHEIEKRYGWELLDDKSEAIVHTGVEPPPWDCNFKGRIAFPKRPDDPEQYDKNED